MQNLDSLLLFLSSGSSLFFSIIYLLLGYPELVLGFIPLLMLGLVVPVYVGYIRGAMILDTLEERVRGWIYFCVGSTVYISQAIIWFLGKTLKNLPSPIGSIASALLGTSGFVPLGYFVGKGTLTNWISNSILQIFNQKLTILTEKIFEDTTSSAFYASMLFFFSFVVYTGSEPTPTTILFAMFGSTFAIVNLVLFEIDIRKFVRLNQFYPFLDVKRKRTKPRIPSFFAEIGAILFFSGIFLVLITPLIDALLNFIMLKMVVRAVFATLPILGILLVYLSRGKYTFSFKIKKKRIPKRAQRELAKLLEKKLREYL